MQDIQLCASASENKATCLVAALYIATSVALTLVNKIVLSIFEFDFPAFLLFLRTLCTAIGLEIANVFGALSLPPYSLSRGQMFALPSIFHTVNAVMALSALGKMNIAFYAMMKRCTPLTTMVLSVLILRSDFPSKLTVSSLIILAGGCIIAGIGDLTFSPVAYTLCALSNVAQSLHLIFLQRVSRIGMSPIESVHIMSVNTLPFFAIYSVALGEFNQILEFPYYTNVTCVLLLVLQILLGCLMMYLLILCTSMTSAVTTTVIGGLKALFQLAVGVLTFGGLSNNLMTFVGFSMSIVGVVMYLIAKVKQKMQSKSVELKHINSNTEKENTAMNETIIVVNR